MTVRNIHIRLLHLVALPLFLCCATMYGSASSSTGSSTSQKELPIANWSMMGGYARLNSEALQAVGGILAKEITTPLREIINHGLVDREGKLEQYKQQIRDARRQLRDIETKRDAELKELADRVSSGGKTDAKTSQEFKKKVGAQITQKFDQQATPIRNRLARLREEKKALQKLREENGDDEPVDLYGTGMAIGTHIGDQMLRNIRFALNSRTAQQFYRGKGRLMAQPLTSNTLSSSSHHCIVSASSTQISSSSNDSLSCNSMSSFASTNHSSSTVTSSQSCSIASSSSHSDQHHLSGDSQLALANQPEEQEIAPNQTLPDLDTEVDHLGNVATNAFTGAINRPYADKLTRIRYLEQLIAYYEEKSKRSIEGSDKAEMTAEHKKLVAEHTRLQQEVRENREPIDARGLFNEFNASLDGSVKQSLYRLIATVIVCGSFGMVLHSYIHEYYKSLVAFSAIAMTSFLALVKI